MTARHGVGRAWPWVVAAALAAAIGVSPAASAPESCSYDAATKTVNAVVADGTTATLVVSGGALHFGAVPAACGAATTTNTDSINITGNAGTDETLILDHRGGFFGPGVAAESNLPEIEMTTALGDTTDRVVVYGTNGPDHFAAGQNGFATSGDGDLDIRFSPNTFKLEVHLLDGDDYFNGRGESGAGLHFLGPIVITGGEGNESLLRGSSDPDSIQGGPGNDELRGQEANDVLDGGPGDDILAGGGDADTLIGGPGVDNFIGSTGDDQMLAHDDERDLGLNGGPDFDTARVDVLDPQPVATEIVIRPSESCEYDGTTKALALTMTPASTATLVVVGGALWWGETPEPCGAATTTNVDSISITGAVGTSETLILDQRGGVFGPGATPEFNTPEIEMALNLGDAFDRIVVYGTEGRDYWAAGQNGLATSEDGDLDITLSPNPMLLEMRLLGGDDHFDARGTGGAGLKYQGPVVIDGGDGDDDLLRGSVGNDTIDGGPGHDVLDAQEGDDVLRAGPGDDTLGGGGGNDSIDGGPGVDTMNGSGDDDTFLAQDDEADAVISGGGGADTAYIDTGLDPDPVTVETVIGDDAPPPPPPASGCTYDAAAKSVRATLAAGGAGTLVVAGTELRFGSPAVACGGATTTNTDTILVTGASGSVERLTVDLSGGLFAPGATSESSGASEIEISLLLGDVTDVVVVTGSAGADSVSIGSTGMSFTSDGDGDVSMSPLPGAIEVLGLDGADTLSGKGGAGTGTDFPNKLVLHGGDGADALTGGSAADELYGGPGNDVLSGRDGNDKVDGGADNDSVAGNVGDDELIGGAGVDALIGSDGDDLLRGDDDEADTNLNGGPGTDTAHYDAGIDPAPVATEIEIAA